MLNIKNAIMEVLSKHKTLDETLSSLDMQDKALFLQAFYAMNTKLSGTTDIFKTADNGQWTLTKATLDYKKINAPKDEKEPRTIDYSSPEFNKPIPAKEKPWQGSVDRRNKVWGEHEQWRAANAPDAPKAPKTQEAPVTSALETIEERKKKQTEKSEIDDIKAKYIDSKEPSEKEKIKSIKDKFREQSKQQEEAPIKLNTAAAIKDAKKKKTL